MVELAESELARVSTSVDRAEKQMIKRPVEYDPESDAIWDADGENVYYKHGAEIARLINADSWHPVSEGLPEESGWYLCTGPLISKGLLMVCRFDMIARNWVDRDGREMHVIAWRPLQEPYNPDAK